MEEWKPIDGTNGMYEVSNTGKVRSMDYKQKGEIKELKAQKDHKGYLRIRIARSGRKFTIKVHREVATAFIPNPENKPQVNHKDGNKTNNSVDNLEWANNIDNAHHAMINGLWENVFRAAKEANEKQRKPVASINLKTGERVNHKSVSDAEKYAKTKHVCAVLNGKRKSAGGYKFERIAK